jgi:hypothetical protein
MTGMDIKQWVGRHVDCNTPVGDLARDMRRQPLEGSTLEQLLSSMRRAGACKEALATLGLAAQRAAHDATRCGAGCCAFLVLRGKQVYVASRLEDTGRLMVLQITLKEFGLRQVGWVQSPGHSTILLSDGSSITIDGGVRNLIANGVEDYVLTLVFE